ncbi:unnamed protein product [Ectocarpus sp. 13 AM-2016]
MFAHFSSRCKALGVLRVCHLGFGSQGCHASVSSVLVLNRQAGGRPGKRRKHRGDYKVLLWLQQRCWVPGAVVAEDVVRQSRLFAWYWRRD